MSERQERNARVIKEFRENGGKVTDWAPLVLVTMKGAKTGKEHIIPLMYVPYGNGVLAVASKGGAVKNPEWYTNIQVHPDVTVELGNETFESTARVLSGDERARAFLKAIEVFPPYAEYQQKTAREIPVIMLERPNSQN